MMNELTVLIPKYQFGHSVSLIKSFRLNHFTSAHTDCMVKLLKNNIDLEPLSRLDVVHNTVINFQVNTFFKINFCQPFICLVPYKLTFI